MFRGELIHIWTKSIEMYLYLTDAGTIFPPYSGQICTLIKQKHLLLQVNLSAPVRLAWPMVFEDRHPC